MTLVAESPGEREIEVGRPFTGPAGQLLTRAMFQLGVSRDQFDIVNVISCRPNGNRYGVMETRIRKENARRVKAGLKPWPSPADCCRPRLLEDLRHSDVIALGGRAAKALLKTEQGIFALRGGPAEVVRSEGDGRPSSGPPPLRVLPTFHPSFVMRALSWTPVWVSDLSRALRWFRGDLRWTEPEVKYNPSIDELRAFLFDPTTKVYAYDLETDGINPDTCNVRSIQIANERRQCVVCAFWSLEGERIAQGYGERHFYQENTDEVKRLLTAFLVDPDRTKIGHNSGSYDRQVIEQWLGVVPAPHIDNILLSRLDKPELPHSLGVVGSFYTDVSAWKADNEGNKLAWGARSDMQLWEYGAKDAVVTMDCFAPLVQSVIKRGHTAPLPALSDPAVMGGPGAEPDARRPGWSLVKVDHWVQELCVELRRVGMFVDQKKRQEEENRQWVEVHRLEEQMREALDDVARVDDLLIGAAVDDDDAGQEGEFKPGSYAKIKDLFYNKWDLTPVHWTATGEPSTGDDALREHLIDPMLTPQQRSFISALRRFRRVRNKFIGTYLAPLRREDDMRGKTDKTMRGGLAWAKDGRVHGNWNAHVTQVGRLSSSKPNLQNHPIVMRHIFVPEEGNVLCGADLDQAHLRIIASRWQVTRLLECFSEGGDPHLLLGLDIFGDMLRNAEGFVDVKTKPAKGTKASSLRDMCKTIRYAGAYGAAAETIWRALTKTEHKKTGELLYAKVSLSEVKMMHEKWMRAEPEWQAMWEWEMNRWKERGFTDEPVMGRRCDFSSEDDRNAIINYPILACEAAIMHIAGMRLREAIPPHRWGPGTGIINQCHDAFYVECPEGAKDEVLGLLQECMNVDLPGWDVSFTAEAGWGMDWSKVA